MRRLLFISKTYSTDFGERVGGAFQRLRILLEACSRAAEVVDILFFVEQYVIDEIGPERAQASLRDAWGIEAIVHLAPRAKKPFGPLMHTIRSIVDFKAGDSFYQFTGDAQVAAIRAAMRPDTDLLFAHRIYLAAAAFEANLRVPTVIDLDDIEHRTQSRMWRRPPRSWSKTLRFLEYPTLVRGEIETIRVSDQAFVCSESDRRYLMKKGLSNISVIANAVTVFVDRAEVPVQSAPTLLFVGTYSYAPNVDAAEYLMNEIFPLVRERLPDARLLVVGEGAESLPSHAACRAGVEIMGYVPDLEDVYARTAVACCPVRVGGGTRVKILEAAARGKPTVATSIGAEGLDFVDGSEIVLRDTTVGFATACVDLLNDVARARAIGTAARGKVRALYDREQIVECLVDILREQTGSIV